MDGNAKRVRADQLVVMRGLAESRTQAQRLILAGMVRIGPDHVVNKPGALLPSESDLCVDRGCPYVSRGALKLEPALDRFSPVISGAVALDVGASTGGFTDLLLQRGAAKVYAVDSGYGQLHLRLRDHPRVVCLERTNARHLSTAEIPEPVSILTADVSFISLTKIMPACAPLLSPGAWAFTLIKPQFEAGRELVGRGGVVRDEGVRTACVTKIVSFAEEVLGWVPLGVLPSPILGPKGNQEFMAAFRTPQPPRIETTTD